MTAAGILIAAVSLGASPCIAATPAKAATSVDSSAALIATAKAQMLTDPQAAQRSAAAAKAILLSRGESATQEDIATAEWLEGEAYVRLGSSDIAKPILDQAWNRIKNNAHPTKLTGDLLQSRGWLAVDKADVSTALGSFQQAYRVFQSLGEARSESLSLMSIASLYREANDFNSSIKYYKEALDIYKSEPSVRVILYNNLGNIFSQQKNFRSASETYAKALETARAMKSPALQAQILRNIARMQLDAGNSLAANRTILKGLAIARDAQDESSKAQFLEIAARSAYESGNISRAESLIEQSLGDVADSDDTLSLREAHDTAYKIYKKTGRDELALKHLEAVKQLDDQTASLAASANTALMAARFDYTNQNLRIAKLKADELQRSVKYERAHARSLRLMFIGAGVATLIIVSMLIFGLLTIRRSRNQVRAANIGLEATNTALAKALAAKTEFLATTSHEIRTPLNGILGMTQVMLADRGMGDQMRDRIGVVHSAGITMRALVDDILDVAKMETGNMTIERAPMDVCAVLRDVARVWEDQARTRGLEFVLSLEGCPAIVEGDAARLRQVVFNLLSNALKFTEAGTVTLRGEAVHGEGEGGSRVRISVSDTGIGIEPDKQEEIFESFKQADTSTTRRFGGTGLGLAICRNLSRAMGGDVSVISALGKGTTFTIDLPLVEARLDATCAVVSGQQPEALLIVDRNPISRSMLRALFEGRAGAVEFAGSLDEAASRVTRDGIARVLIDDATARACGDDLPAALAAIVAARAGLPIALLWANPEPEQTATLMAAGIERLIAKPIAGPDLLEAMYPTNKTNATNGDDRANPQLVPNAA